MKRRKTVRYRLLAWVLLISLILIQMPSLALASELENENLAQSEEDVLIQTDATDDASDSEAEPAAASGAGDDKTVIPSNNVKAGSSIIGIAGEIAIYKYDANEQNQLLGAKFQLTESSILYDNIQTTDGNGYAVFTLFKSGYAGDYTLTEITPPTGYAALAPMSITIDAAGAITEINGTAIPAGAANGTIISDSAGNVICVVSPNRLFMVLYGQEEEESTTTSTVTKVWNDNNDQDGKRPTSIQVQLYTDGTAEGSAVTLTEAGGWTYTWNNLPEKQNGTDIVYAVTETGVPTGYTSSTSENGGTFTITNSYTPETVDVSGEKIWDITMTRMGNARQASR